MSQPKILTIILAETRSHELTWESFYKNLLLHINSDLALCISNSNNIYTPFHKYAKYIWYSQEYEDWGDAYNQTCGNESWRKMLHLRNQLFGGIVCKDDEHKHEGSAGILIYFRYFLLKLLEQHKLLNEYDWFIITRSDHYYQYPHPKITDETNIDHIFVPEGEDYSGITDRHIVVSKKYIIQVLNLMERIIQEPNILYEEMKYNEEWNLEQYIKFHFEKNNLIDKVIRFPRIMYAVKSNTASTRWAEGQYDNRVNMVVKYGSELNMTLENEFSYWHNFF